MGLNPVWIDCGTTLPHGQHWVGEQDDATILCDGKRKSDYVDCGASNDHPQHRTDDGWCLGIATPEQRAKAAGVPIVYLTPFELISLLEGRSQSASDADGNEIVIAKHSPETLLDAHRAACEKVGEEPNLTYARAVELTRGA